MGGKNPNLQINITKIAVQGTIWNYVAYILGKLLSFVTTIILARLILPEEFGLVGYSTVFIQYLDVVNTLGMGTALISRRDRIVEAANAAFAISTILGFILFAFAWVSAPMVAVYFKEEGVINLVRIVAITLPLSALGAIPNALISRNLRFRTMIIPEISKSIAKGLLSIILAWQGFGAWSLIWGQVAGVLVGNIAAWTLARWRPTKIYDREVTRELLSFGGHIIAVGFIGALLSNVDYIIVGRILGAVALGYYTLAYRMPELIIQSINLVVSKIAHPVLSNIQMASESLHTIYGNYLRYTSLIIFPAGTGIAILSSQIIRVFYTPDWDPSIEVMRWIAISLTISSMGHIPGVLYKAINRPDILNKLAIIKLPITLVVLWYGAQRGIVGVAIGHSILAVIKVFLDTIVASRIIKYEISKVIKNIGPSITGSFVMGLAIYILGYFENTNEYLQLVSAIVIGGIVYFATTMTISKEIRKQFQTIIQILRK